MNRGRILGIAAALSWAPASALLHLALPMPLLQTFALALLCAFFAVRGVDFVRGVCPAHPLRNPAAALGLGAVVLWGAHLAAETSIWSASAWAWGAVALLGLGPVSLSAWAWRATDDGDRGWIAGLAAVAYVAGRWLI